jgi:DNA polymerase (family 10)
VPGRNDAVAAILHELAVLTEIEEGSPQAFRVRAYQNAVRAVEGLSRDVADLSEAELTDVKGIGRSTAAKIREFLATGTIAKVEALREQHPPGQLELLRIPGIGPKTVVLLQDALGVTDLAGLVGALDAGRVRDLPGLGERTEENLRRAIDRLDLTDQERRLPIARALPLAERLTSQVAALAVVDRAEYAGSLRRFRDTIGDVDILAASVQPAEVMAAFRDFPDVSDVLGSGDTKTSIVTWEGVQVDLRVVTPDRFGAALVYFTGSKAHNIRLRQRALARGLTLNEYALATSEGGEVVAASAREEDIYAALDLHWVPPELREDVGEVELAEAADLPDLVSLDDLRGDLHVHSDYSGDGRAPLEDMVAALATRGHAYAAITDHAEDLRINGVNRAGMLEQRTRLRRLAEERGDITLLHGAELNIGRDGSLDYDREFLLGFDFGVASVHSHFGLSADEQTDRIVTAMRHPGVNVIGHLLGRRIGKRPPIEIDLDAVLDAAVETGCAIEINANLDRLDAPDHVLRAGVERGVTFVVSTDAHSPEELDNHRFGVRQARRGGVPRELIANTWEADRFLGWVRDARAS